MSKRAGAYRAALIASALMLPCAVLRAEGYPRDRAALRMIDRAINEEYLRTSFDEALRILLGTIEACEDKCSPAVLAKAFMYVGIVRGTGKNDQQGALEAFREALARDANVQLDADLAQAETRAAFETARSELPERPPPVATSDPPPPAPDGGDDHPICPPGLAGCIAAGDACRETSECQEGLVCRRDEDDGRKRCSAPKPEPPLEKARARHWIGLEGALDFALAPAEQGACSGSAGGVYRCYVGDAPYAPDLASRGTEIASGFARGGARILLTYAYELPSQLSFGARAGLALEGAPEGFLPAHFELLAKQAFGSARLRPLLLAGGGVAQVDAPVAVHLPSPSGQDVAATAYASFGRFFACAGAGAELLLAGDAALEAGVRALWLLPDSGLALLPSVGLRLSP